MDWSEEAPRRRRPPRRASGGFRLRDAVYAGIASIAVGALGGAIVYDRANDGELSGATFDSIGQFITGLQDNAFAAADTSGVPENLGAPVSFKKPVTTAKGSTSMTRRAKSIRRFPLLISAEPAMPDQDIALRLTGLPTDLYLTAGTKLANNAWLLKPREAMGVKLMVRSSDTASLLISV